MMVNQYKPVRVSPPGDSLQETLDFHKMTIHDLACRTGFPQPYLEKLVAGDEVLYPETARELERVLGVPEEFWVTREETYRASLG